MRYAFLNHELRIDDENSVRVFAQGCHFIILGVDGDNYKLVDPFANEYTIPKWHFQTRPFNPLIEKCYIRYANKYTQLDK